MDLLNLLRNIAQLLEDIDTVAGFLSKSISYIKDFVTHPIWTKK
jgi:hypothetical protein